MPRPSESVRTENRKTSVAFTNYFDATTFGRTVYMTAHDERRLRDLLAALQDWGFVLRASFEPALPSYGFDDAVDHLRESVGATIVDAALAARDSFVPGSDPPPTAVMPVWAFEPEACGGDVLLSSARVWGTDLLVEALRVEGDDDPAPVPSVRDRFARWADAAGQGRELSTVRMPGRDGCYVLFAATAPA